MTRIVLAAAAVCCTLGGPQALYCAGWTQSAESIEVYDFVEWTLKMDAAPSGNPFTDARLTAEIREPDGSRKTVEGFCDSPDGTVYRARFMPSKPGDYSYSFAFKNGSTAENHQGRFRATAGERRGLLRVDPDYPFHFIWEGTKEHYFWNGTTTYWLAGWDDDTIQQAINRLHALRVNRLRVVLTGRVKDGRAWYENVFPTNKFKFVLNPWVAARPDSVEDPGMDVTRFNPAFWQKYERILRQARERDMIISVVFYVDGSRKGVDPFGKSGAGGPDEQRYYRYAVARLAPFSNITWDVANEYRTFRDDPWAEKMGTLLKKIDVYQHLTSVHGHEDFRFRKSPWADFAMYQMWDECGGYQYMVNNRLLQLAAGRPMPQINEEYGYEDHYPPWGCGHRSRPARSADNRRQLAFEMYMAGGYQTTGERADRGTGWGPDTGGGWVNGRGDDTMVMLKGYGNLMELFTSFEWWKAEPHTEVVNNWAQCLAEPGRSYLVRMPNGGSGVTVQLAPGEYQARWFDPRSGKWRDAGSAAGPRWTSPDAPSAQEWALLLLRREKGKAQAQAGRQRNPSP